jgi:hypothetical protein
VFAND